MESISNNEQIPFGSRESAAIAYDRIREQSAKALNQKLNKELDDVNVEIDQLRLEYGEYAAAQGVSVVLESDGLPHPVPITEHKFKNYFYLSAEVVLYLTSIALLAGQLFSTLDLDQRLIIAIIVLTLLLMAVVLPLFITDFFKVSPKNPESKEPIEKIFFVSLGIGIIAFIAFSMTRGSSESEGVSVWAYLASLPICELSAATAASCCAVLRKQVSWSLSLSRKFQKLDKRANKLRNEIVAINKAEDPIIVAPSQV